MTPACSTTASELQRLLAWCCPPRRIDLAGVVPLPCPLPHDSAWREWIVAQRHGGLNYLARDPEARADPTGNRPWARSILVFGQRYSDGWQPDAPGIEEGAGPDQPWLDGVSRYARGEDYHDVLLADVRAVLSALTDELAGLHAEPAVDTGPYLEREYAWLAGLGFWGKNNLLIHERLGSGLFLAVAPTNLVVEGLPPAGEPASEPLYAVVARRDQATTAVIASRCGRCRRCLDACPTGALVQPYELDAGKCISTWTIEWRGQAPGESRERQGGNLFGCDICQAVCPWNHKARRQSASGETARVPTMPAPRDAYAALPAHGELTLADLLSITPEDFRRCFRSSPLWRAHPDGLRRNALTVAANTGRVDLVEEIAAVAAEDPEPSVRAVARWALVSLAR